MMKYVVLVVIAVLLGLWDSTASSFLPYGLSASLTIPCIAFLLFTERPYHAWALLLVSSGLQEVYQWSMDGSTIVRWVGLFSLLFWITTRWLTNRSLYTMLLVVVSFQIMDWLILWRAPHDAVSRIIVQMAICSVFYGIMMLDRGRMIRFKSQQYGAF